MVATDRAAAARRGAAPFPFLNTRSSNMVDVEHIRHGRAHALGGGVVAGVIGGIVIALVMLVAAQLKEQDLWPSLKGAAAPFLGERAMQPGFDGRAVALGVVCHFAVSIVWGVLFAAIFYGLSRGATVAAGVLWGIIVWLGMFYLVLPIAGLSRMASGEPITMAILSHVIFGLAVAIGFLPYQHPHAHAAPPTTHAPAPL
ncbi:MAG TPA: DUF6789 family protein [Kofleriaceae bacterium]|nr:DUF6789 family protein [Kofleriaceae bacterium]